MWWWFPFQITITEGWLGLAGVFVGFILENIRNRKVEKQRNRANRFEKLIFIYSKFEGICVKVYAAAIDAMTYSVLLNVAGRTKQNFKNEGKNSGPEWDKLADKAKEYAVSYLSAKNRYNENVSDCHALMTEFKHYLPNSQPIDELIAAWSLFSTNKFGYVKEMPINDFKNIDNKKVVKDIHEKYLKELQDIISPISKMMNEKLNEAKNEL